MDDATWVSASEAAALFAVEDYRVRRAVLAAPTLRPVGERASGTGGRPASLYRWGDLRPVVADYLRRAAGNTARQTADRRRALLAAIRERPGTLAEILGRTPAGVDASLAAALLRDGLVTRDVAGRYAINPEPPTAQTRQMADNGHGRRAGAGRLDGRATGKKRTGHGG